MKFYNPSKKIIVFKQTKSALCLEDALFFSRADRQLYSLTGVETSQMQVTVFLASI